MEKIVSLPWQTMKKQPLEITLAKKAKNGDSHAFTELYKIYKVYLYKFAYSYIKDENKALDILQECAYKGFLNVHKLKNPSIFKTWITRILINVAIDYVKKDRNIIYLEDDSILVCSESNISGYCF
ncbi:sigma factor [Clostridium tarantellae]|nr:sigma factor [Clostridium tarantellae]